MVQMAGPWRYFLFQLDRRIKQYGFYLWCKLDSTFILQIMTPKARADIHMNLPALQKLDSMLIVGDLFIPIII
jgi:hypothetical protein